jgi:hypothetical protein
MRLYSAATTSGFAALTSSCSVGSVSTLNRQPDAAFPFGGGLPGMPQSYGVSFQEVVLLGLRGGRAGAKGLRG